MIARLCAEEISVTYGSVRAVDSWSISVAAGSCVGIVGANGAGKSSFMRALAGLQRPSGGSWAFDGQRVPPGRPWQIAARGAAFVPEGRELFRRLTVEENIRLGSARLPRHERDQSDEQGQPDLQDNSQHEASAQSAVGHTDSDLGGSVDIRRASMTPIDNWSRIRWTVVCHCNENPARRSSSCQIRSRVLLTCAAGIQACTR